MTSRVDAGTWRAVCPKFGQDGHTKHVRFKDTFEEAEVVVAANDHLYEQLAKIKDDTTVSYYRSEIGWRIEQAVTEWETVT